MISFIQNAFYFILLISVVVFIHEYGHYYYAKKYAEILTGIEYYQVGVSEHIEGFMKKIENNPLLLKAYGGKSGLKSIVAKEFDGLPF